MRFFQNKMLIGIMCVVLAALLAFVFLPSIMKEKSKTEKIYAVKETIAEGTQIEESMLTEREVGGYGIPESVVRDKSEIVGKFASCTIVPDDYILSSKLSDYAANQKLDVVMGEGKMLVTVSLNSVASAVGNHLKTGDIVSIVGYADGNVVTYDELKNLEIYSIENEEAQNLEDVENDEEAQKLAATVTLIADRIQAEKLVDVEYSGKVHAVFVRRGALK